MTRISLVEQYDNRSVIEQIRMLADSVSAATDRVDGAVTDADAALRKANALEPRVTDNTSSISGLDTRVTANTGSIDALDTAVGTDTDSPAIDGSLFARVKNNTADIATNAGNISSITGRVGSLEVITADAITSAEFTADASTVTSVHKHLDQAVDSDALPVASITQAGVINATDYRSILQMRQDINDLKGTVITYQITLPSDEPTQPQITLAFTTAYPTVSLVAGIKVADYNYNLAYQYDGSLWVEQQFTGTVPISTSTVVGGVLSSSVNGEVAVNVNGTMSLNGYDSITGRLDDIDGANGTIAQLASRVTTIETDKAESSTVTALATRVGTAEGSITTLQTNVGTLQTNVGTLQTSVDTNTSDIATLQTAVAGKENTLNADQKRTITVGTGDPTGGSDGDIYIKYEV